MSTRNGIRVTTADAYLAPGSTGPNLTIQCKAQVDYIVFDGTRATGVRLVDGTMIEASWVVLCGGTYGSPVILQRSGIGPSEQVSSAGVSVRVDLPGVGTNLVDHPAVDDDCGYRGAPRDPTALRISAAAATECCSSARVDSHGCVLAAPRRGNVRNGPKPRARRCR